MIHNLNLKMKESNNTSQNEQYNKYPTMDEMVQKKVEELIDKFSAFKVGLNICHLSKKEAKQCALFVCDELLNDGKMIYAGNGIKDANYKFWVLVKDSLNSYS